MLDIFFAWYPWKNCWSVSLYLAQAFLIPHACPWSQNHRMNKNGRHHQRSSSPTSLLKQDPLEQIAQDCIRIILEYFQWGWLNNLSGQPVPVISHTHSKGVLLHVQVELPLSACCLSPYCLALLSRAWVHPLDILPSDIYRCWWNSFYVVSSPGRRGLIPSAFLRMRDAPILLPPL